MPGALKVRAPRVHDSREGFGFSSHILPRYARRSPKVADVLPVLYLRGLLSWRPLVVVVAVVVLVAVVGGTDVVVVVAVVELVAAVVVAPDRSHTNRSRALRGSRRMTRVQPIGTTHHTSRMTPHPRERCGQGTRAPSSRFAA